MFGPPLRIYTLGQGWYGWVNPSNIAHPSATMRSLAVLWMRSRRLVDEIYIAELWMRSKAQLWMRSIAELWMRSIAELWMRSSQVVRASDCEVPKVLGSMSESSVIVESEGRQMKQC